MTTEHGLFSIARSRVEHAITMASLANEVGAHALALQWIHAAGARLNTLHSLVSVAANEKLLTVPVPGEPRDNVIPIRSNAPGGIVTGDDGPDEPAALSYTPGLEADAPVTAMSPQAQPDVAPSGVTITGRSRYLATDGTATGADLRRVRKLAGLTGAALGKIAGFSNSWISRIETGRMYKGGIHGRTARQINVALRDHWRTK